MTSRKKGPDRPKPEASVDPGLSIPPILPDAPDEKRKAVREAAARLAKMTPEEQAAALFRSLGAHKKD
jgi:transglutaminase-like putative cysteine protease